MKWIKIPVYLLPQFSSSTVNFCLTINGYCNDRINNRENHKYTKICGEVIDVLFIFFFHCIGHLNPTHKDSSLLLYDCILRKRQAFSAESRGTKPAALLENSLFARQWRQSKSLLSVFCTMETGWLVYKVCLCRLRYRVCFKLLFLAVKTYMKLKQRRRAGSECKVDVVGAL